MKESLVALVQMNVTVGDLSGNADKIIQYAATASYQGAAMVIFPEMALSGYPPEDLVLKAHFVRDCEAQLQRIAFELPSNVIVVVGAPRFSSHGVSNTASIFWKGREVAVYRKIALPNYGVFDEKRLFVPGDKPLILTLHNVSIGVQICEDSWISEAPWNHTLAQVHPDFVVNLSASPYHRGKLKERHEVIGRAAQRLRCPLLYCNLVGGQDELVFDGASFAVDSGGRILAQAPQFRETILYVPVTVSASRMEASSNACDVVPLDTLLRSAPAARSQPEQAQVLSDLAEVYEALKLGTRDYVEKSAFRRVIVALSGGIDSALVATIAVDALGKERVVGITMPSQYTSAAALHDAERLAQNLGIEFHKVPITPLYEAYLDHLRPLWHGAPPDVTEENLQARIRGNIVMALSNKFGWLVLTTGNKSELATGYCTLYGDMAGGFAVLKDVPKVLVFELARWRNQNGSAVIPESIIRRLPSAELRPNQKDTDSLPPYEILDPILELYVEAHAGLEEIVQCGYPKETVERVIRLVDSSEYKRRQAAPGIKITPLAFGRDRRMPITNRYRG